MALGGLLDEPAHVPAEDTGDVLDVQGADVHGATVRIAVPPCLLAPAHRLRAGEHTADVYDLPAG
jgi:hypothetical protein